MYWLLLILFFGMIMTELASASTTVQNNTVCYSITEKTKHTFKQEIFCDYARNNSNITIPTGHSSFSGGGSGVDGGIGGFYCEGNYSFNASTKKCFPKSIPFASIHIYEEKPTTQKIFGALFMTAAILLAAAALAAVVYSYFRKKLRGKK